jgi:DUF4097 and DUF4098 domain-containing protein YvlB
MIRTEARRRPAVRPSILPRLAAALAVLLLAAVPALAEETRRFDKSFPLAEGGTVRLANLAGRVELAEGSGGQVRVEVTVHAEGKDAGETRRLLDAMRFVEHRERSGNMVWAVAYPVDSYTRYHYPQPEAPWGIGWGGRTTTTYLGKKVTVEGKRSGGAVTLYADLKFTFPRQGALAVRNALGSVRGGELGGDLDVDTGSGDVEIAGFEGTLKIDTGSGDVTVGRLAGSANVDTGSGDVEVGNDGGVEGTEVLVDTGSGDVMIGGGRLDRLSVDTGSGDVKVIADLDAEAIDVDTGSGDVVIRSPLTRTARVVVDTGSGDVEIWAGSGASFKVMADQGSGDLDVRYADARLIREGRKVVGAERGDGHTRIDVDTGSGDCVVAPSR